jgi:hypothetical protein
MDNEQLEKDGWTKIEGATIKDSRGLFLKFLGNNIYDTELGTALEGQRRIDGTILRFKGGKIHGGKDVEGNDQPAIECTDVHTEWWEDGLIHKDNGPAIISQFGDWEEYWNHGVLQNIIVRKPDNIQGKP